MVSLARRCLLGWAIGGIISGRLVAAPFNPSWSASPNGTRNVSGPTVDFITNFGGVPGDVTNNATALASFGTYGAGQSLPFTLTVTTGVYRISSSSPLTTQFGKGIRNYTMLGDGGTLSVFHSVSPTTSLFVAGLGQQNTGTTSARISADANPGDTMINLVTPSQASRFPIGAPMLVTCNAIQGTPGSGYGFPTNAQFFDFVTVTASDPVLGTVSFTPPLTEVYKTTYPLISDGSDGSVAQGGPAWAYALDPSWDCNVLIKKMGFDLGSVNDITTYGTGRTVNFEECSWSGDIHGPCPSQNLTTSYKDSDLTNNNVEIDKFIGSLTYDGCSVKTLWSQSSSVKTLTIRNCPTIDYINGTPRHAVIENNPNIRLLQLGAAAYGASEDAQINNNVFTQFVAASYTESLATYGPQMSGGVIRVRKRSSIAGCQDNGSGKVQLVMASTADLATGMTLSAQGVFVIGNQNIPYSITVVDSTKVDLLSLDFSSVTWTGTGYLAPVDPTRWMVIDRWVNMLASGTNGMWGSFKILALTEDATYYYATTSLAGGWPAGIVSISPHPCQTLTASGNSGCPEAIEMSMAGAQGKPVYSYVNRTYTKTLGTAGPASTAPVSWGKLLATDAMSVDVQTAYTGVQGTLYFRPTQFPNHVKVLRGGAIVTLDMRINAKVSGKRTFNGVTNTWGGAIDPADILPAFQSGDRLVGTFYSGPTLSADVSGENAGPVIVYEIKSDQEIS